MGFGCLTWQHKVLREASWCRAEEESEMHEFLSLLRQRSALEAEQVALADCNSKKFCEINGLPPPKKYASRTGESAQPAIKKTKRPADAQAAVSGTAIDHVLVLHLEEAIFKLGWLLNDRDVKIRSAAAELESSVRELAKKQFFLSDLKNFEQPHVQYYCDDDDGRSLVEYDFNRDELAECVHAGRFGQQKFYRERSFRYRVASYRHDNPRSPKGFNVLLLALLATLRYHPL